MAEESRRGPRRWLEIAFLAVVGAGLVYAAWGFWHDREFPGRFAKVRLGMDRNAVHSLLGEPSWEGVCAGYVPYLPRAGCSSELGYSSAFAPISADHHIVQLDRSGKVIEAEPAKSR